MIINSNVFIIFGISEVGLVIDKIICDLNAKSISFDLRLLITEGVSNAFYHGNKGRTELPIYVRYQYDGMILSFEIEDSGDGFDEKKLEGRITNDNLLKDSGRGIYLIRCYCEDVTINYNKLIIKKLFII